MQALHKQHDEGWLACVCLMSVRQHGSTIRLVCRCTLHIVAPKRDLHGRSQLNAHLLHCFLPESQLVIAASPPGEASLKDVGVGMGL